MYHIVTKEEYFNALDIPEVEAALSSTRHLGLKHTQDACLLHCCLNLPAGKIVEIGGGNSRTLPFFHTRGWSCSNMDTFQGVGNGPVTRQACEGVTPIAAYLGKLPADAFSAHFDVLYSISVIEHVNTQELPAFFKDMFRILKPGGLAFHAVDVYLGDAASEVATHQISRVATAALNANFLFLQDEPAPERVFRCSHASNPDLVIRQWNKSVPALKERRACSQSVSLLLGLRKPDQSA